VLQPPSNSQATEQNASETKAHVVSGVEEKTNQNYDFGFSVYLDLLMVTT